MNERPERGNSQRMHEDTESTHQTECDAYDAGDADIDRVSGGFNPQPEPPRNQNHGNLANYMRGRMRGRRLF